MDFVEFWTRKKTCS